MNLDQGTLTAWADRCKEQARQVMHLAGETHELITMDGWTLEDCDEFMDELDEELEKLKNLYKQFLTDKLNLATRHEAFRIQNNVNMEVTRARKIVQQLITIHGEGPWINVNGVAFPPSNSRSSRAPRSFRGYQPEVAQPSPVLQGVVNCRPSPTR
jgi:hypothetical protein